MHQSGFVAIVGKPNAGKSTLLNTLLGQDLSIVTPKAQTTRHRIRGVLTTENYQLIFSDTPGIITPGYKLHERMMSFVQSAFADADVILLVLDAADNHFDAERFLKLNTTNRKLVVALNKIDLSSQEEVERIIENLNNTLHPDAIVPISAKEKFGGEMLVNALLKFIPEAPPYFDKDMLTDRNERFFASEIIREKIFLQYDKEIPYSIEVAIEEFKDLPNIVRIRSYIFVERESQKAILLGKNGAAIKKLGMAARKKIETMVGKKVFLELTVKIRDDWRNNEQQLTNFGYTE
ncbi:MAG TPA: GTPase Era [Bacteroidia bacterium]|nr:GTPase Era [Bacteroidia bacterium]MBX3105139.1 GTPase Era [Bacteroidota bacterium]MBV6453658.1 GTPase Era [Bacteroidia bacterium]MCB8930013.1 GTPase Era [Bacteroidia bacterium]MCW5932290.1 GTPase Era [Bacteroidota bacterium]